VLEGANIKLSSVASDVLGKSGRAMIEAMIAGEENPELLSERENEEYVLVQSIPSDRRTSGSQSGSRSCSSHHLNDRLLHSQAQTTLY
jgi:hypothetical protein